MLFDTHAHLTFDAFDADRAELLAGLETWGLLLNPGSDLQNSRAAAELAERHPRVYAAAGVHPHDAQNVPPDYLQQLEALVRRDRVVAVGEIGLDYHYDYPREVQQRVFREQLALAQERELPVIIHDREAHRDCMDILAEFPQVQAVFHCYSGSADMAKILLGRGYFLSFTGVITFPNARKTLEVLRDAPAERILAETDAPYLTPVPHRGKRNEPSYVRHVVQTMADVRGVAFEEMAEITTQNGMDFFGIHL
jgi:TatD DNase family protein